MFFSVAMKLINRLQQLLLSIINSKLNIFWQQIFALNITIMHPIS